MKGTITRRIGISTPQTDLMALLQEVIRVAPLVLNAHREMQELSANVDAKIATIKQGPPGIGYPGRPGRDGRDAVVDLDKLAERISKRVRMPKDGKDGKTPNVPKAEDILAEIEKKKLKIEHIAGLDGTIKAFSRQLAGLQYGKDTWARGGGDTIAAGSGVSISTSNGVKTISATPTILTATGTVDDSNKDFTFTSKPTIIYVNGNGYRESHGWSWNSGTLTATLDNPVGVGGDLYGI